LAMPLESMRNQYRAVFDKCNNKTAYEKEDYLKSATNSDAD